MRVMRILTRPNVGGPTLQAAALFAAHAAMGVQTLLVVGRCSGDEPSLDLRAHGVPTVPADAVHGASNGSVVVDGLGGGFSARGSGATIRALVALMRAFAPDVVHTHTSRAGWLGRRAAHRADVPIIAHTFHGLVLRDYFGPVRSWLLARLERWLAARTDLLFAVSPSCADEVAACGVASRLRLQIAWPAVPLPSLLDRDAARRAVGLPAAAFAVAFLGRLVPIKRLQHFLAAVAAAPGCTGHVHGDGPQRALLEAAATGLGARMRFFGASTLARTALPAYDALVLPSVREGCPLVAIEAFAAGVPVVGYDVPGVRDVVTLGGGVLVDPAQGPGGLAAALLALRADGARRMTAVARGRAAVANFAPDTIAAQLRSCYAVALATCAGRRRPSRTQP